jgi:hypothetical protein
LNYLVHRFYDPASAQFISVDPELTTTTTPYAYVGDNPIISVDPLGEISGKQLKRGMWVLVALAALQVSVYNADVVTRHWAQQELQVTTEEGTLLPSPEDAEPITERIWGWVDQSEQGEESSEKEFRDLQSEIIWLSRRPITTSPSPTFYIQFVDKVAHISDVATSDLWNVIDQPPPTNLWSFVEYVLIGTVVTFIAYEVVLALAAAFL